MIRTHLAAWLHNLGNRLNPPATEATPDRPEVYIDTPGPSVTIKAAGDLDTIAAKALEIYQAVAATPQAAPTRIDLAHGIGFHTDRRDTYDHGYGTEWHQTQPTQEAR